jgi:DNA-binding transcriptional LysR family regulator
MSILKMKLIVLIDQYKQVTAVAGALGMKQPTISFHMKNMETEWGVKLFQTRTGRILLTEAGRTLLQYAIQIDKLYTEAESRIAALRDIGVNRFVIGCTDLGAAALVRMNWLASIGSIDGIRISTAAGGEGELISSLQNGLIDLIISGNPPGDTSKLAHQIIGVYPLKLVVPAGHPLGREGKHDSADLSVYPFVAHTESSIAERVQLWETLERRALRTKASFQSTELLLSAVRAGLGLSVLPAGVLPESEEQVAGIELPGASEQWTLYAIWRQDYWNSSLLQQVLRAFERSDSIRNGSSSPL